MKFQRHDRTTKRSITIHVNRTVDHTLPAIAVWMLSHTATMSWYIVDNMQRYIYAQYQYVAHT